MTKWVIKRIATDRYLKAISFKDGRPVWLDTKTKKEADAFNWVDANGLLKQLGGGFTLAAVKATESKTSSPVLSKV